METYTKFVLFNVHRMAYVTSTLTYSPDIRQALQWNSYSEAREGRDTLISEAQAEFIDICELEISYRVVG